MKNTDFLISCKGEVIHYHKQFLSAASIVFARMLETNMKEVIILQKFHFNLFLFTDQVQASIKFSISCIFQGKKHSVDHIQALCGVKGSHNQFNIGYHVSGTGLYKVSVKIGEHHVVSSPLLLFSSY